METASTTQQASDQQSLLTLGQVARAIGQPQHRVKHAVCIYGIAPVQRAGILRLWSPSQIPEIVSAMKRCAERRVAHV